MSLDVQQQIAALWNRGPTPFRAWLEAEKAKGVKSVGCMGDGDSVPLAHYALSVLGLNWWEHSLEVLRETWWYSVWKETEPEEYDLPLWAAEFMGIAFDWDDCHDSWSPGITPSQALRFLGQALNRPSVKAEQRRLADLEPLLPLRLPKSERPWRVPV